MKTILVPTDFSEVSKNATDYASEMAKLTGSTLVLLHVYQIPVMMMPLWADVEQDCMLVLKKQEEEIHGKYGTAMKIQSFVRMGFAVDEIIHQCAIEQDIDLIVMAMQGAGYVSEKLMGSVTTSLIKQSSCPVLVINEYVKFKNLKKIVLAFGDKNFLNEETLKPLKELAKIFKAQVCVLNVVNTMDKLPSLKTAIAGIGMEQRLEGLNHSFHFIENKDVITGINNFAAIEQADMIVIIPQKHKFLDSIFHEANTKRMAFHTSIPLLALHDHVTLTSLQHENPLNNEHQTRT